MGTSVVASSLSSGTFSVTNYVSSLIFALIAPGLRPPTLNLVGRNEPVLLVASSSMVSGPLHEVDSSTAQVPGPFEC